VLESLQSIDVLFGLVELSTGLHNIEELITGNAQFLRQTVSEE
jgi:hypothetical protein